MHGLLTVKCNIKGEHYFLIQEFHPNTLLTIGVTYTSEWRAKSGSAILLGFLRGGQVGPYTFLLLFPS